MAFMKTICFEDYLEKSGLHLKLPSKWGYNYHFCFVFPKRIEYTNVNMYVCSYYNQSYDSIYVTFNDRAYVVDFGQILFVMKHEFNV